MIYHLINALLIDKNEAELSQENQARSSSMLQSLKKQVNDLEQQCSKEKAIHTQLESHNGQLQTKLKEKVLIIISSNMLDHPAKTIV